MRISDWSSDVCSSDLGDRDVARDILGGICDIGIANAYYVGRMKNAEPGTDNRKWGDAIKVVRPTFADEKSRGTHVNISGASVAKHAPNKENAVKLLEYLVSDKAQSLYANANYEIGRASCRERVFQYV